MRCDANVSVRKKGEKKFGTKTEVKNMNSFRFVERALEFEINRQIQILEEGGVVEQETLLWDANQSVAHPMRSKEEAHDYRYFPEPDLVPVLVDEKWRDKVQKTLPEHPTKRRDRFVTEYNLPSYDANVLTEERNVADYFESTLNSIEKSSANAKAISNWVMTDVLRVVSEKKIDIKDFPISTTNLSKMIQLLNDGTISSKIAKDVFEKMLNSNDDPKTIVEREGLVQLSDESAIEKIVLEILENNKAQVEKYRSGNEKVFGFFVGEVMKATKGKANPSVVNKILKSKL